jgi:leucyl-tRNA synthetase
MQRNWIGRSEGAEVDFYIGDEPERWLAERHQGGFPETPPGDVIRVFTTRPDTLFGATYMVLAPEHPLVDRLTTPDQRPAVADYRARAASKSDLDRAELARTKTGVPTGATAVNPASGQRIPIWIADYVLMGYGTGAIMAVPGHDERDFDFAQAFRLPIKRVVASTDNDPEADGDTPMTAALVEPGVSVNSANAELSIDGLPTAEAKAAITAWLWGRGLGAKTINYKLRDWLFSRQRYWGEPFPIVLDPRNDRATAVALTELPVLLPELADFRPSGKPEPPLGKATDWVKYSDAYVRETNTMPQWAGSCWYFLRYLDPRNNERFCDPALESYWMPVDLYVGGAEHAVLHLLYSRFWHKVLYDRGHVSTPEPFQRLVNQGMILGETEYTGYRDEQGNWVSASVVDEDEHGHFRQGSNPQHRVQAVRLDAEQVDKKGEGFVLAGDESVRIDARAHKMSKSRGNVIRPDAVVEDYGADSLRLYEMFMGPLEAVKPWSMKGVEGVYRFLGRAWRMIVDDKAEDVQLDARVQDVAPTAAQARLVARTVAAVTDDVEAMRFNTAISRLMEFTNAFTADLIRPKSALKTFTLVLAPLAPHLAEELWQVLGHDHTLAYEPWPTYDPALLKEETIEVPVQVSGKLRGRVVVAADADAATIETAARGDERIAALLAGKVIRKVVVVPGKLINFVVS